MILVAPGLRIFEPAKLALLADLGIFDVLVAAPSVAVPGRLSSRLNNRLKNDEAVFTRRIEFAILDKLLAEPILRPVLK